MLATCVPALTEAEFESVRDEADRVQERLTQRQLSLRRQLSEPEGTLLVFTNGVAPLRGWSKLDERGALLMEQGRAPDHTAALCIVASLRSTASWRAKALLSRGRYRFEGLAKVAGVKPLPFGIHQGAGLRVAGNVRQSGGLLGDSDWRLLSAEFEVTEGTQELELVCELRACAGKAWFATKSLRLIELPGAIAHAAKTPMSAKPRSTDADE